MKTKPYKAKSLSGAQAYVRRLRTVIDELEEIATERRRELKLLAMLAAKGPAFYNPLEAMEAEQIRDRILRDWCKRKPDGSPL